MFNSNSVKELVASVGANLQDDEAKELAEAATYHLRCMIQDAKKFMEHGHRVKLSTEDINHAHKVGKAKQAVCILEGPDALPFQLDSDGKSKIHFNEPENKEAELSEIAGSSTPDILRDLRLGANWLEIEEVQPSIPKDPPPQLKGQIGHDSVDSSNNGYKDMDEGAGPFIPVVGKPITFRINEHVFIKKQPKHDLSVEQQLFYKDLTEACIGSEETRRARALQSLSNDPGICELLPRLSTFIQEGIRCNVVDNNMALLIYLMRMVKNLLSNQTLDLEKYLHELIPSIASCIVSKQLCTFPEKGNHWVLRDFSSKLMAEVCQTYTNSANNIQLRIAKLFSSSLNNDETPLVSIYGAVAGLGELGNEVVKEFIIPNLANIGTRVEFCLKEVGFTEEEKTSAQKIKRLVVKLVCPVLKSSMESSVVVDEYKSKLGYFASSLQMGVLGLRNQDEKGSAKNVTATGTDIHKQGPKTG